jgi:hypothetical protein
MFSVGEQKTISSLASSWMSAENGRQATPPGSSSLSAGSGPELAVVDIRLPPD